MSAYILTLFFGDRVIARSPPEIHPPNLRDPHLLGMRITIYEPSPGPELPY